MPIILEPSARSIELATKALSEGKLVGLPTETVYGLAVDATNSLAVAAVFAAKDRPHFNPLISHVATRQAAERDGIFSSTANKLAEAFWPGPLTLVVPRSDQSRVADLVTCGLPTIALRVPNHPIAQAVLADFDGPVAAPSANKSGRPSPTLPQHVETELGEALALILDGGPCTVGLESTVVSVVGDQVFLLRSGGVTRAELQATCPNLIVSGGNNDHTPASPGMLTRHYAPITPLIMDVVQPMPGSAHIGFGKPQLGEAFNLSETGNLIEAAANLFAMVRLADTLQADRITISPIPNQGLGEAINDRLRRGAAR